MQAFFVTFSAVALAEMGDRTQLLALMLAACYRKPWVILAGIVVATLFNHLLAGAAGILLADWLNPRLLNGIVAVSLFAMAIWTLFPDKDDTKIDCSRRDVFLTTVWLFFLAEIGDKTQIATATLAAAYKDLIGVVSGSLLGMLAADIPAVFLGRAFADRLPAKTLRRIAAGLFAVLAVFFAVATILG